VNGVHQTFLIKANEKNLDFKILFDYKIPNAIIGDPVRLMQILNNLVANSIKFTNYGNINIVVTRQQLLSPNEIKIRFEVKDSGIGIPIDQQSLVFEMFTDNESNSSRKYGGTGLGLTITKKLIEAFNSEINLISEAGAGSNFYFDINFNIPADITVNDDNWQINFNSKRSLEGLNVLLVEDNNYNQMVINKYMNNWKVNLDIVNNGKEALEKTKTTSDYHIILMDMHMPELNGLDTVKEIRKSKNIFWQKIPIIALTADAINFEKEQLNLQGFNDIIYKPFDPVELFKKLIQHSSIFEN
jgi:CheY-like chemotaxis protein